MDSAQYSVLLIAADDDEGRAVRRALAEGMPPGCRVLDAERADAGLRLWREHQPDCVVLGRALPDLGGDEALAALAAETDQSAPPVVALVPCEAAGLDSIRRGAQEYVVAAEATPAALGRVVARAVARARAQRARQAAAEGAALRRSQTIFATAFRAGPILLSITRLADGRFIEVNEQFLSVSGYSREEVIGRTPLDLDLWVDPGQRASGLRVLRESRELRGVEAEFRVKSGEIRTCLVSGELIELDGETCVLSALTDITERKRAERLLERYRLLSEHSHDMMFFVGADGRIVDANATAAAAYGYSRAELLGMRIEDMYDPAAAELAAAQLAGAPAEGIVFESVHRRRDGTTFPVEVSAIGARVGGEQLLMCVIRDITERRRAEEAIGARVQELRTLLDLLPVGVWLTDAAGGVKLDNPAGAQIWGAQHGGQEHYGKYKGWWVETGEPLAPGDWSLARVLSSGEPALNELIEIETFAGDRKIILNSTVPILDSQGRVAGAVVVNEDVTPLYRAEEALRTSEIRFRALTNAIPMIVWTAAPGGALTYANDQWLRYSGLSAEQLAAGWPDLTLHPDDRAAFAEEWARALEGGTDFEIEARSRRADGEYRWFLTRAVPARDERGRIIAWYGTATDVNDRKLALAEAREAVRAREVFLSVASHELKNPLTALLGNAQLLRRRATTGSPLTERDMRSIGVIADQAARMNHLIEALLDVSRLERGQLQLRRAPLDLAAVVRQVADEMRPGLLAHALHVETPSARVPVIGDEIRLAQVLHNLIGNAVKYSPDGRPISVRLAVRGSQAEIAIADQGVGIPAAALPHLFRHFYRAENAVGLYAGGLGVGLYVVKEIVTLHGGTIAVESREGRGSTFTLSLPLAGVEQALPAESGGE